MSVSDTVAVINLIFILFVGILAFKTESWNSGNRLRRTAETLAALQTLKVGKVDGWTKKLEEESQKILVARLAEDLDALREMEKVLWDWMRIGFVWASALTTAGIYVTLLVTRWDDVRDKWLLGSLPVLFVLLFLVIAVLYSIELWGDINGKMRRNKARKAGVKPEDMLLGSRPWENHQKRQRNGGTMGNHSAH